MREQDREPAEPVADGRPRGSPEQAAALGSAVRLRILRLCFARVLTNKQIAERLGRDPATTLHHVRRLVDTGLLEALPVRRGSRGSRERPYRATGLSWRLRWDGEADRDVRAAMLAAYLAEVVDVGVDAVDQTRLVLQLDPSGAAEFRDRLAALLEEFVTRSVDPAGDRVGVYLACYPADGAEPAGRIPPDVPR